MSRHASARSRTSTASRSHRWAIVSRSTRWDGPSGPVRCPGERAPSVNRGALEDGTRRPSSRSVARMSTEHQDAIVVGAGFAGLYALHRLRDDLGLRTTVLEAGG